MYAYAKYARLGQRRMDASRGVVIVADYPGNPYDGMLIHLNADATTWVWSEAADTWLPVGGGAGGGGVTQAFYQDAKTVTTAGAQSLRLTHLPDTHSEHLYANGHYELGTEWSRSERMVTIPAGNGLQVGDTITVEYCYTPNSNPPLAVTLPSVTTTSATQSSTQPAVTSIALPAGTQVGDQLILGMCAGYDPNGSPVGQAECNDPRFTLLSSQVPGSSRGGVWIGFADDLSPVAVTLRGSWGNVGVSVGDAGGMVARIDREYAPWRVATSTTEVPAIPDEGAGALAVVLHAGGLGGSTWTRQPPYTASQTAGTYKAVTMQWTASNPTPASANGQTAGYGFVATGIGFRYQYPA